MKKKFNWGIIGCGRIAAKFARDLAIVPNANLYAIASRSEEKAKTFGEQFGAAKFYGNYEALTKDENVDVIYIATPHAFHCENTLMCLDAKIPVLCEKPIAINQKNTEKMIAKAKATDTFLMEAIWTRFIPAFKKVLSIVENEEIGAIRMLKADFGFKATYPLEHRIFNRNLGGGSLLDVGIYPIFLSKMLLGNPKSIQASAVFTSTKVDESCAMIFQYENDALAILDSSIGLKTPVEARILGTKGSIYIHTRFHQPAKISVYDEVGNLSETHTIPFLGNGYGYEIEEVQRCLAVGKKQSDALPLSFSLELMKIMDEVRRKCGIVYPNVDL